VQDPKEQLAFEFARLSLMSLAFVVALYAFLAKESRLREGIDKLLLVVFLVGCSSLLSVLSLFALENDFDEAAHHFVNAAIVVFSSAWVVLLFSFWRVYGRRFHMREKRFFKYVPPFAWLRSFLPARYESTAEQRTSFSLEPFALDKESLDSLSSGCSVLIVGDPKLDLSRVALHYFAEGLANGETGDYVCCHVPPYQAWDVLRTAYPLKWDDSNVERPHFIDAFSGNLAFGDTILQLKMAYLTAKDGLGMKVVPARGVAGVHTACNTSWRKNKKKRAGRGARKPHRMVYDRLSTLVPFSSTEQIINYIMHCCVSERAYGMISIFVEPSTAPEDVLNAAYQAVDCVIECERKDNQLLARLAKCRGESPTIPRGWFPWPVQ